MIVGVSVGVGVSNNRTLVTLDLRASYLGVSTICCPVSILHPFERISYVDCTKQALLTLSIIFSISLLL